MSTAPARIDSRYQLQGAELDVGPYDGVWPDDDPILLEHPYERALVMQIARPADIAEQNRHFTDAVGQTRALATAAYNASLVAVPADWLDDVRDLLGMLAEHVHTLDSRTAARLVRARAECDVATEWL